MKRLLRLALLSLAACSSTSPAPAARPPNIVLILADDVGWADLGCYGNSLYRTPNLDRLRRQGMKFTDAYASSSQCAPTRACLISGRDIGRHGVYAVDRLRGKEGFRKMVPPPNNTELPLAEPSLGEALRRAGYATGMIGKWHLGLDPAHAPGARGFEHAVTFGDRYEYYGFSPEPPRAVPEGSYLTDYLGALAVDFLRANRDRPFFLYLPHFAVHGPHVLKRGKAGPRYAAMMESLDESVGAVLRALDDLGLAETTAVFFTSDNGGVGGYAAEGLESGEATSNLPLRGGKGMLYEGGIRVPLLVRWPSVVTPGSSSSTPVISTDFFPTFLEMAAATPRADLDGRSLLPLLRGGTLERKALFWHYPSYLQADVEKGTWRITPSGALRSGRHKLIEHFEDGRLELYDLEADLGERENLAARDPDLARGLQAQLAAWRRRTGAPMPAPKSG